MSGLTEELPETDEEPEHTIPVAHYEIKGLTLSMNTNRNAVT